MWSEYGPPAYKRWRELGRFSLANSRWRDQLIAAYTSWQSAVTQNTKPYASRGCGCWNKGCRRARPTSTALVSWVHPDAGWWNSLAVSEQVLHSRSCAVLYLLGGGLHLLKNCNHRLGPARRRCMWGCRDSLSGEVMSWNGEPPVQEKP